MQGQQQQNRVQLVVYDLSRGMATTMSQQILGQQIDGIWHTGILVFGVEYFFGGGIQAQPEGIFARQHQMPPVRMHDLGSTSKQKSELQTFLMSIHNQFNASTYNLLRNNCNNFSDTVSQFLVGSRIPSYIVDLPAIVFNTPGGRMLLPMIENMSNSVYSQQNNGAGSNMLPQTQGQFGGSGSTFAIPDVAAVISRAIPPAVIEDKPLISSDNKTVEALGNKILCLKCTSANEEGITGSTPALSDVEKEVIILIMKLLSSEKSTVDVGDVNKFADNTCELLSKIIANHPTAQMSCLFLARLLLLRDDIMYNGNATTSLVDNIITRLSHPIGTSDAFGSVPSVVMALCTIANLLSHSKGQSLIFERPNIAEILVDVVLSAFCHSRVEVRQMSATVGFNFVMAFIKSTDDQPTRGDDSRLIVSADGELNPFAVQLFCGTMEGVTSEKEHSVRYRRFCIALTIARLGGDIVGSLGRDLGFENDLTTFTSSDQEQQVSEELKRRFNV